MADAAFLTERRREIIEGKSPEEMGENGIEESTQRFHRSETKRKARIALKELIEVAESDEIDNSDVFDVEDLDKLHTALLSRMTPPSEYDGDLTDHNREYPYENAIITTLVPTLLEYSTGYSPLVQVIGNLVEPFLEDMEQDQSAE